MQQTLAWTTLRSSCKLQARQKTIHSNKPPHLLGRDMLPPGADSCLRGIQRLSWSTCCLLGAPQCPDGHTLTSHELLVIRGVCNGSSKHISFWTDPGMAISGHLGGGHHGLLTKQHDPRGQWCKAPRPWGLCAGYPHPTGPLDHLGVRHHGLESQSWRQAPRPPRCYQSPQLCKNGCQHHAARLCCKLRQGLLTSS